MRLGLSGAALKWLAVLFMAIDHVAYTVLQNGFLAAPNRLPVQIGSMVFSEEMLVQLCDLMRGVGSLAFPLFAFLMVEGFFHTRSVWKYGRRLIVLAFLSEIPFDLAICGGFSWEVQNVFFTLAIGLAGMELSERYGSGITERAVMIAVCCGAAEAIRGDWGVSGILFIMILYLLHGKKGWQAVAEAGLLFVSGSRQMAGFLIVPLILLYNGKRGFGKLRYFFYWFYPVHLAVLAVLIRWMDFL